MKDQLSLRKLQSALVILEEKYEKVICQLIEENPKRVLQKSKRTFCGQCNV